MAYEDVDYCLRAGRPGWEVIYEPAPCSPTWSRRRAARRSGRARARVAAHFWAKWGDWFDERDVRTPDGGLRIVYVTEDTGVGGGHRDVFEHLNRLPSAGTTWSCTRSAAPPDWFHLEVPVRTFEDYDELARRARPVEAIKVATWWATAPVVWRASVTRGIPVYFVQDIETSYYPGQATGGGTACWPATARSSAT